MFSKFAEMSQPNEPFPLEPSSASTQGATGPASLVGRLGVFWDRFDAWSARAGDYLNPILVKETRQALKSRQFVITFGLLLLCGWLWSMMVLTWGPSVAYGSAGNEIFAGYFCILAFPLIVVIPFSAYRSLAAEWEDGTYDLMSISTLTARQIVTGKLGSAILQMIVYLSAIAPCVAFTYLLRGVDVLTINYLVFWLCMNSLVLTFFALALATVTRQRVWQVFVSVVLIAGCLFNFFGGLAFVIEEFIDRHQALPFDEPEFWTISAGMLNGAIGYCVLFLLIARARLMFPTENRSTALRVTMLAHYAMFVGWIGWGWAFEERYDPEMGIPFMIVVTIHWYVMGMFMTAEGAELSPRVRRELPQSFLGRVFLTWFNPGSGTGYVFAVVNLVGAAVLAAVALNWADAWAVDRNESVSAVGQLGPQFARQQSQRYYQNFAGAINLAILAPCYVVIYLGLGRLIIRLLRRYTEVNMFVGVVFHLGLLAAGNLMPLLIQSAIGMIEGYMPYEYSFLQYPAPFWSMTEAVERPFSPDTMGLKIVLLVAAVLVAALNLPSIAREVQQLRVAKPKRVEEDDLALNPPPPPQPVSPWDDDKVTR